MVINRKGVMKKSIEYVNKVGTGPGVVAPIENMHVVFRCCHGYFLIVSIVYKYQGVVC